MLALLSLAAAIAAEPDAGFHSDWWRADSGELHVWWIPDLVATGGLFATFKALNGVRPRNVSGVAEPAGIDATSEPRWNDTAAHWSDLLGSPLANNGLNLPVLSLVGVGIWGGVHDRHAGAGAMHTLVVAESYMTTIALTEGVKVTIARPRPYTSLAFREARPETWSSAGVQSNLTEDGSWDACKSMPSGHTSGTAAYAFSIATLVWRDASLNGRGRPWVAVASYGTAGALTAAVGTLRVTAGRHHPTDTIVGGLLGAGIATGVTWLHTGTTSGLAASMGADGAPALAWQGNW